eukprot:TRINITY_DN36317_c0_g3_i2.p1 TRINITY_DN36317_c0_g3~~TRINITY_DN36317_c0_g3_i2.p1  ORF type:complete len:188 (+),score=55.74 TRINITY_DN36317_c0_g3_i2:356-919(+)
MRMKKLSKMNTLKKSNLRIRRKRNKKNKFNQKTEMDEDQVNQYLQLQEQIEQNNRLLGTQPENDDDNDIEDDQKKSSDSEDDNPQKQNVSMQTIFQDILQQEVKKGFSNNPILSEHTRPLKKVKTELKKYQETIIKQKIKKVVKERGHILLEDCNQPEDKEFKTIATKGIIKIFDGIKQYQKLNNEE